MGMGRTIYSLLSLVSRRHAPVPITDDSIEASRLRLERLHPDGGGSCLRRNVIMQHPTYDVLVIIPAYNVEKYVVGCVDSVVHQQTSFSFQVKVIDDGSTDSTWSLLQRYSALPNVCLIRKENGGLGSARNEGLREVDARYVMFVDSDDELPSNALQRMMEAATVHPDVDIVEGQYEYFAGERILHRSHSVERITSDWTVLQGYNCMKFFKSRLFQDIGFPEGYWFEDTVGQIMLYGCAREVMIIPDVVYRYRCNIEGICHTAESSPKILDTVWVTLRLLSDRLSCNMPFTQSDYEVFLYNVANDVVRLQWLGRKVVDDVIVLYRGCRRRYFPAWRAHVEHNCEVERLLDAGQNTLLSFYCRYVYFTI